MDIDWNDFAGKALEVLLVASIVIPLVRPLAVRFKAWTKKTKNTLDDGVAWWAMWAIDGLAALVGVLLDVFPVVSNRRMSRATSADQPKPSSRARVSDTMPMALLAFALGAGSLTTGCAGTTPEVRDARLARWDFGFGLAEQGLLDVGEWLDPLYREAEEECHQGDAYETCIRRWDRAIDALSTLYYSVRIGRDGFALGDGAEKPPCIASMVGEALAAVQALELEHFPDEVQKGLRAAQFLAALLDGECRVTS